MTDPHPHYPSLPLEVAGFTLPNRVMGSMHVGLEDLAASTSWPRTLRLGPRWRGAHRDRRRRAQLGGRCKTLAAKLTNRYEVWKHQAVTDVRAEGGHIAMQILHAGRYAYAPWSVAPTAIRAITPSSRALSSAGWRRPSPTRKLRSAGPAGGLPRRRGHGFEGYLISEFIVTKTNKRRDQWGGDYAARIRFPIEIVRRIREAVGDRSPSSFDAGL